MTRSLAVLFISLITVFAAGQSSGILGKVIDEDGAPVARASVYSKLSCCPAKCATSTTDEKGNFGLDATGSLLHVDRDGFRPQALVVKSGKKDLQIQLVAEKGKLSLSECHTPARGGQLLGNRHIRFFVPESRLHVSRGEDVDYVNYGIRLRRKGAILELWFGPTAWSLEPDDDLFIKSAEFAQRNIFNASGIVGMDSRGHTRSDRFWRHSGVMGGGAKYEHATPEEAAAFDQIIDSMCIATGAEQRLH